MGAAMVALEELCRGRPAEAFSPERLRAAASETFECLRCENRCGITKIAVADRAPTHFGSVCGRFETADLEPAPAQDAFAARERLLHACLEDTPDTAPRGTIGLPLTLSLSDHLPFWATFFQSLGYAVRLSRRTSRPIVEAGLRHVPAEFCYPVKLLFGHVHDLFDRGQRRIFIPHLRMLTPPGERAPRYACPYTQAAPYVVRENVPADAEIVTLEYPVDGESSGWAAAAAERLGVDRDEVAAAWAAAREAMGRFQAACREEGRRLLEALAGAGRRGAVLVGRPYNTTDRHANLDLARRLRRLGIEPIPFDFLPLDSEPLPALWERIRWGYGRKLVQAARTLKRHPNLGAVIVTNFGCGPDAFVDQYLEVELTEVPHLVLELDDHQAEAGLVTRLEAFARSFQIRSTPAPVVTGIDPGKPRRPLREYTYYIPAFMDHAYAITGALKASGCRTVLLPPTDDHSWGLGLKHAYGRECHPFIAFTGDLLRAAERPDFNPAEACYFGPSYFGPCLLPQYPLALHLILERLGLADVTVMNITDYSNMRELGPAYMLRLALGLYAIDRLYKWKTEIAPREARAGEIETVYREILVDLERGLAERRFFRALRRSIARLGRVPLSGEGSGRPRVGIVGDVYTRVNVHSNNGLYRRLNRMGVDVWTSASVIDVSLLALEQWPAELSRKGRRRQALLAAGMQPALRLARRLVDRCFPAGIRTPQERRYPDVRKASSRYVSFWIDKVLSLNLNRIEELHAAGADGVINVMCHNCMLGTITASLSHSIRRNTADTPLCTLVFEGLKTTHTTTRLEAFAHQLHSRRRGRGRAED
jgi:predicted nucleotide-binding protein (sugar kinase/HSP70/actin superfamily)